MAVTQIGGSDTSFSSCFCLRNCPNLYVEWLLSSPMGNSGSQQVFWTAAHTMFVCITSSCWSCFLFLSIFSCTLVAVWCSLSGALSPLPLVSFKTLFFFLAYVLWGLSCDIFEGFCISANASSNSTSYHLQVNLCVLVLHWREARAQS